MDENINGGLKVALALYSLKERKNNVVCAIQPASKHIKLYIHNITDTKSKDLKLEGRGENSRHIKFEMVDLAKEKALLLILRKAYERSSS